MIEDRFEENDPLNDWLKLINTLVWGGCNDYMLTIKWGCIYYI